VARADIGNLLQQSDMGPARQYVARSVLMVSGFGALYLAALWVGYGWVATHFLPAGYHNLEWLIVAWSLYFVVYNIRNVGSVLLAAMGHFKPLFKLDVAGLVVQAIGIALLVPTYGAMGLIVSVALCECVLVVWMWSRLVPRLLFVREVV
jgi:O-antigen/teichoic acid export membrane protein